MTDAPVVIDRAPEGETGYLVDEKGAKHPYQRTSDGKTAVYLKGLKPYSFTKLVYAAGTPECEISVKGNAVDNGAVKAVFDKEKGGIASLVMDGKEYSALLGSTSATSLSLAKEDLNSLAVSDLSLPRNATSPMTVWVEAATSGLNAASIKSSNVISFNVTTYDPPKSWVFFPGYYNSWGDNNDKEPWRVWEVEGGSGVFRTLVQLKEDAANTPGICPLKLYMEGSWLGGKDGYEATWDGWDYGDKDGNWGVPADEPINIIEFNKNKKTASRTALPKGVGLIGSFAASGWGSDVKFQYDDQNNLWVIEEVALASGDEFLVHLNEAWDKFKYGGPLKASDAVPGGFDLVQGGDSANIPVTDGGTYKLILHANRTPMVLEMVKK